MAISTCGRNCSHNAYGPCEDSTVTYEGAVLETYERNGYDDSDFYALVWNGEKVISVEYASTRGWTYHNTAYVDATEDVRAAATDWYRTEYTQVAIDRAKCAAITPGHGKRVRSLTKRGKNVGIEGTVMWVGDNAYRMFVKRLGVKVDGEDKLRYLDSDRVEVINPEPVDEAAIRERAMTATPANWRSAQYQLTGVC